MTAGRRLFSADSHCVITTDQVKKNLASKYHAAWDEGMGKYDEQRNTDMAGESLEPQECFVQRFMLIHEYRSSPYVDPNLPLELLPDDWLGEQATQLFQQYRDLLVEGAEAFVESVLAKAPRVGRR